MLASAQERIVKVVEIGHTVLHYGWIPLIIYVGFTRSNPQPSLIKCVCCCSIFLWSHLVCADSSALLHSVLYYAYYNPSSLQRFRHTSLSIYVVVVML
ncbi:TOM7 family-domain-containing protein [Mycena rebaudengoi]|nr:TOM7 family-domain-containing protein [Mycena rebaudengoi]KAJ7252175.1 TOM7 family-domain-containing protein [Mycena rebaudengoi]